MSKNHKHETHHVQPQVEAPKSKINLELIVSLTIIMVTTLGTTVPLYLYTMTQTTAQIGAIHQEVRAIQQEMRDFHGRLCAIEERNRK